MDISLQIEAVFRRALLLRQRATELPIQKDLMEEALRELYYVLDELQASEAELRRQNQELSSSRHQLEAERQRYQDLFNLAPDGYLVTDSRGKIQQANLAIATMLNVSQQFLVGKPLLVFISEESRPAFQIELTLLYQQKKIQDWEIHLLPRKSQSFDVAVSISIIRDPVSSEVSLRWLLRDITESKQIKVRLEHLNTELECQVQERTDQLQQALNFEAGLKRITDNVRDNLDEAQILQFAVTELALLPDICYCDATFYDATQQTVKVGYAYQKENCKHSIHQSSEPVLPLFDFSEVYAQLQQDQSLQFCLSNSKLGENPATILICPLTDDQVFLGTLLLLKDKEAVFNDLEIRLLQQVANQCAIAIRQARLYQVAQGQVQ